MKSQYVYKDSGLWYRYPIIRWNQLVFESLLKIIKKSKDSQQRVELCKFASRFALFRPTGYLASSVIENVLIEEAEKIPEVKCERVKNTVLHVFSYAAPTGGHTNVCRKLIHFSPLSEIHSVVLLDEKENPLTSSMMEDIKNHKGQVYMIQEDNDYKRAYQLRKISSKYDRIILYVGNTDITPVLAFGTNTFTTPIIFFNHSDDLFWIGNSIIDKMYDFRINPYSSTSRQIESPYIIPLPPEPRQFRYEEPTLEEKKRIRKVLGLPENEFIIITVGRPMKYTPIAKCNLSRTLRKLCQYEGITCIAIGPNSSENIWKDAEIKSNGKLILKGTVTSKVDYYMYLRASDLYLCSSPMCGATANRDAIACGLPFVNQYISSQSGMLEEISLEYKYNYGTEKDLINAILNAKESKDFLNDMKAHSIPYYSEDMDELQWISAIHSLYDSVPPFHSLHSMKVEKKGENVFINDLAVVRNRTLRQAQTKQSLSKQLLADVRIILGALLR